MFPLIAFSFAANYINVCLVRFIASYRCGDLIYYFLYLLYISEESNSSDIQIHEPT